MYKKIVSFMLMLSLFVIFTSGSSAQYNKSIKVVFTAGFDTPFNAGGQWQNVDQEAVESTILSRMSSDFSAYGISVSETSGNMIVEIGVTGTGFGLAVSGLGSYVSSSNIEAEVYSTNFSTHTEWQGANATVARIAETIAGTASHEAAHLLNCYHAYASHTFDPAIANHLYANHTPREPNDLEGTTGDDYPYKYIHLMATQDWITLEQRAIINRSFANNSDLAIDFATDGGTTIDYNTVWGIGSRSFNQGTNVAINNGKVLVLGGPSYTHNLNGYYIKASGTGKVDLKNGVSTPYWKITNTANTIIYGLYPSSASAIANWVSGQKVRTSDDTIIYPVSPPAPTNLHLDNPGDYGNPPELDWTASAGVDTYFVYVKYPVIGSYTKEATVTTTAYTARMLELKQYAEGNDQIYFYVTAYDGERGESDPSNTLLVIADGAPEKMGIARLPHEFGLDNNYPNPFNPVTTIKYQLPEPAKVTLTIFNILGQEVERLVDHDMPAGYHSIRWDARNFSSGTYFYKITAGSYTKIKKMLLIK